MLDYLDKVGSDFVLFTILDRYYFDSKIYLFLKLTYFVFILCCSIADFRPNNNYLVI